MAGSRSSAGRPGLSWSITTGAATGTTITTVAAGTGSGSMSAAAGSTGSMTTISTTGTTIANGAGTAGTTTAGMTGTTGTTGATAGATAGAMTGATIGATIAGADAGAATSSTQERDPAVLPRSLLWLQLSPAESKRPMAPRLGSEGPALERGLLFSGLQAIRGQARFHLIPLAAPAHSGARR